MAILITGGAGYIGSHVVRALHSTGAELVVFDNLEKGHREAIANIPFVQGDLRRPDDLNPVFAHYPIDAVMHFAAYIEIGESMRDPARFYRNNVTGTANLLAAMQTHDVKQIIFSSTAAVYGTPQQELLDEQHPTIPTSVYGETKLVVERMLAWFDRVHAIRSVRLRYFNAAGAHPDGDIGEKHAPESHLIPLILQTALGQRPSLTIFGTDYPTPDGTCIRDYIHVCDLADAHVQALAYLRSGNPSCACNLGNGAGYSVREVVAAARRVTGHPIPVREDARRPGDPPVLVASSDLARQALGWQPQLADLDTIIETAWQWHRGAAPTWGG